MLREMIAALDASLPDQDLAVFLADELNRRYVDGATDHYESAREAIRMFGNRVDAMQYLYKNVADFAGPWEPDDVNALRLQWALLTKAERERAAMN